MQITYPKRNDTIETTLLADGHLVLFNKTNDLAHTLSPTAGIVWEYCDGKHSVEDIVCQVANFTKASDQPALTAQVTALIADLLTAGMLTG